MKNIFIALAALVAVGCSKPGTEPVNLNNPSSIIRTVWIYENGIDNSSITLDFKSSELAILTISKFVELPDIDDLYPGPTYKEERNSHYFYDYVVSDGKIYMTVSTDSHWTFNGDLYIMPADRFNMPSLIGSVSSNKLLLLKDTGEIYATLAKR